MSLTEGSRTPPTEEDLEAWREEIRRIPGVVVHRRTRFGPFVPDPTFRVTEPIDVRVLMGRCDPDDDAEPARGDA